ncbi:metal-dependent hydrolase [Roseateles sp. GG27B]
MAHLVRDDHLQRRARHAAEVQGFIGQEATHRRIHALFNSHLLKQGYINRIEQRANRRMEARAHLDLRKHLAATAAIEHFTALFADWMLRHPEALDGAEPRLQTLWLWHSAEESEHRCLAFDIYKSAGGNQTWRLRIFRVATVLFLTDMVRQTVRNLWHDGCLFKWSTWRSAHKLLFATDGLIRSNRGLWRDYLHPDFHPSQHDAARAQQWLRDNSEQFNVVGQPG